MIDPNTGIEYPDDPSMLQKFAMFMGTPGAAMMGAAMSNLGQIGMGAAPTHNPFAAMQQARAQNQQLMQMRALQLDRQQEREQLRRMRDLQMQKTQLDIEKGSDPLYEFNRFIEGRGIQDMPYEDQLREFSQFQTAGMRGQSVPADVLKWQFKESLSPEDQREFMNMLRKGELVRDPAGGMSYRDAAGQMIPILSPSQALLLTGQSAGAEATGKGKAETSIDQVNTAIDTTWANRDAYNMAKQMADTSRLYRQSIESGQIDTGPVVALFNSLFGVGPEQLAAMDAESVQKTLENLQITNLAPVTVQELRTVAKLWADIARQETPNIGVLRRAEEKASALMERILADTKTQATRARRYGGDEEYNALVETNPFVRQALGLDDDSGGEQQFPTVTTQQQYDALPSGAIYLEDGKRYRKP